MIVRDVRDRRLNISYQASSIAPREPSGGTLPTICIQNGVSPPISPSLPAPDCVRVCIKIHVLAHYALKLARLRKVHTIGKVVDFVRAKLHQRPVRIRLVEEGHARTSTSKHRSVHPRRRNVWVDGRINRRVNPRMLCRIPVTVCRNFTRSKLPQRIRFPTARQIVHTRAHRHRTTLRVPSAVPNGFWLRHRLPPAAHFFHPRLLTKQV